MPATPRAASTTTGNDPPVATPVVKIYNPASVGTPHAVIFNNGASFAYIGGSAVTSASGLPFPPGAQLSLPYANYAIWGVDGGTTYGTPSTSLSANIAAGATAVTFTTAGTVSFSTAQTIAIGIGTGQEFVTISTMSGTSITFTAPVLYDHVSGATAATVTGQSATSLSVNAGTT